MKISLIGDSIRMQYQDRVKAIIGEDFEVFSPDENCRFAKYNLRGMWDWKEGMKDSRIVHWNCGLWDICDIFGDGMFTSIEEYTDCVLRIADILLSRHEKVIFATTTPVRAENPYNDNEQIKKYNAAVVPKLKQKGIIINDLHAIIAENIPDYVCDDLIHLSDKGIELAAEAVAKHILAVAEGLSSDKTKSSVIEDSKLGAPVKYN